jgi:hypothetical protein
LNIKQKEVEEEEEGKNYFNKHHMNFFNEYVKYAFQIINRKEIDSKVKDETKFIIDKIFYHFTLNKPIEINSEGPNSPTLKSSNQVKIGRNNKLGIPNMVS